MTKGGKKETPREVGGGGGRGWGEQGSGDGAVGGVGGVLIITKATLYSIQKPFWCDIGAVYIFFPFSQNRLSLLSLSFQLFS